MYVYYLFYNLFVLLLCYRVHNEVGDSTLVEIHWEFQYNLISFKTTL